MDPGTAGQPTQKQGLDFHCWIRLWWYVVFYPSFIINKTDDQLPGTGLRIVGLHLEPTEAKETSEVQK